MSDDRIASQEERIGILREKARRESISAPDDVLAYVAGKFGLAQTLKGALVRLHTASLVKGLPITMEFARDVFGDAPLPAEEPAEAAEPQGAPHAEPHSEPHSEPQPAPKAEPARQEQPTVGIGDGEPEPLGGLFALEEETQPAPAPVPHQPAPAPAQQPAPATAPAPTPTQPAPATAPAQPAAVWFTPMRTTRKQSLVTRAGTLLERAGLRNVIEEGDLVAVKLHFGEEGNTGFVSPVFVREVVRRIRALGGKPFLTDANTLYRGKRFNAAEHIECALHNGFSFATVEAPIIIADGLDGRESVEVPIEGFEHFESVRIGSAVVHADAVVVITHVKGHEATGFGGAFKNVGMGLGARSAKQRMHADFRPEVNAEKCTACGRCVQWCPVGAIVIAPDRVASVDYELCYGCGECVAACPHGGIATDWKTSPDAIQEKIVEHTAGVLAGKEGKTIYLSFVNNVSPDCDCWAFSDAGIVADIGVLASTDIVAIDQAAYDMVVSAEGLPGTAGEGMGSGVDKFQRITGIDGTVVMKYAEKHGMGTRSYDLRTLQ